MEKPNAQINLLEQLVKEFRNGRIPLWRLVQSAEAIIDVIGSADLKKKVFRPLVALEEVNARTGEAGFSYDLIGRPVVEKALTDLESTMRQFAKADS